MAQATESSVSAILKEVYPGAIEDELNNEIALWAVLDKQKVTLDGQGQHVVRPFRVGRNQGFGARNDTDLLPNPGNQTLANAKINMSSNYMTGQITGRVIRTSYGDDAAFENALEEEIRFGLTDVANEIGRQIYNGAGQLATVAASASASTTIQVTNTQYFAVGMYVEFWNGAVNETTNDAGLATGYTGTLITGIPTAGTITVTTAQTLTNGDAVARAGNNTSSVLTKELVGLDVILDDGTDYPSLPNYFGVNRLSGVNTILKGNRINAAGTLTESIMQQAFDTARQVGGGIIDAIFCDYATRRTYSNILVALKRYPLEGVNAPQFAGGLDVSKDLRTQLGEGLSFSGAMVAPSRQAPPNKMWMLETSSFKVFQQSEFEWVMNDGSILHPLLVNGYDAYRFAMFYDAQLYSEAPNRSAKIVRTFS